jgi:iron complex transport system ATP-binding protein
MTLSCTTLTVCAGRRTIVDHVSLNLRAGELTFILGPNGAGKTSLLKCLAHIQTPFGGTVRLRDQPLSIMTARDRARKIGYLPQASDMHWALTVETLVALGRLPHRGSFAGFSAQDLSAIETAMRETDTTQFAARPVTELSGGERARVLLARVLAGQPDWILADEPLTHLDPAHQLDILHLLQRTARAGVGVCAVLHDLTLAARFADRILLMSQGKIVADGTAAAILTAENLRNVYRIEADINRDSNGLIITPLSTISQNR